MRFSGENTQVRSFYVFETGRVINKFHLIFIIHVYHFHLFFNVSYVYSSWLKCIYECEKHEN